MSAKQHIKKKDSREHILKEDELELVVTFLHEQRRVEEDLLGGGLLAVRVALEVSRGLLELLLLLLVAALVDLHNGLDLELDRVGDRRRRRLLLLLLLLVEQTLDHAARLILRRPRLDLDVSELVSLSPHRLLVVGRQHVRGEAA